MVSNSKKVEIQKSEKSVFLVLVLNTKPSIYGRLSQKMKEDIVFLVLKLHIFDKSRFQFVCPIKLHLFSDPDWILGLEA